MIVGIARYVGESGAGKGLGIDKVALSMKDNDISVTNLQLNIKLNIRACAIHTVCSLHSYFPDLQVGSPFLSSPLT